MRHPPKQSLLAALSSVNDTSGKDGVQVNPECVEYVLPHTSPCNGTAAVSVKPIRGGADVEVLVTDKNRLR
jgi:hypothetical protein